MSKSSYNSSFSKSFGGGCLKMRVLYKKTIRILYKIMMLRKKNDMNPLKQ